MSLLSLKKISSENGWLAFTKRKKINHLFIGQITKRFLYDEEAAANRITTGLEIDCLVEKLGRMDSILGENPKDQPDIDTFAVHNVICTGFNGIFQGETSGTFLITMKFARFV